MEAFNRRREDDFMYKINRVAAVVLSLGVLGGALYWLGSTKFVDKVVYEEKCERTEKSLAVADKTIAVMQTDIEYIKRGVDQINRKLDR